MTEYEVKYMKLWEHPAYYAGETYEDYYPVIGQHRDSETLDRVNFKSATEALGGEGEHVIIARASHWAVGWCETLLIHKDAPDELLKIADEMVAGLEDYPVIDDEAYSAAEWEETQQAIEDFNPVKHFGEDWNETTQEDVDKWEELKEKVTDYANGYNEVYYWLDREWGIYLKTKGGV